MYMGLLPLRASYNYCYNLPLTYRCLKPRRRLNLVLKLSYVNVCLLKFLIRKGFTYQNTYISWRI